jgi:hypothetical protein
MGSVPQRVFKIGLVFGFVRLGLYELSLEGPRVDLNEQITRVHELPFGEGDLDDVTIDPALDSNRIERLDCADTAHNDWKVLRFGGGGENRDGLLLMTLVESGLGFMTAATLPRREEPTAQSDGGKAEDQYQRDRRPRPRFSGSRHAGPRRL